MLDRQKVQLTSIMWREPSALGPDIIATYEGDTLSVRCQDGGLVVASLRRQPFKYAAVARDSPDMPYLDSAPCHECNPTPIWRSEARRVGKEGVSWCKCGGSPNH